jgi:hypothetical protein
MDRVIVQVGALPQDTDILSTNLFALIDGAFKNQALLGSSTVVAGLGVTPTTPTASLQVNVATGSIFQMDEVDASAYGSLGTNTANVMKQGILSTAQVLSITPPTTSGYSQVFLVQAILNDVDGGSEVESYYNSANPAQPFSGPNNSGSSNYTVRQCKCVVALKAGTAASTGSQTAPSPDAGYVGLFAITVANGATQITSGNIVQLGTAPFFTPLPQIPSDVQNGTFIYGGTDSGTANNYVVTFLPGQPIPTAYTVGMNVRFKVLHACTGASVVNVNGLGNVTIQRSSGVAVATGDIISGQMLDLVYDGTYFQMINYLGAGATSNTTTAVDIPYVADSSGTANVITATFSPAITSGEQVAGLVIAVKLANTITGATVINVNGLGNKAVTLGDTTNPPYNVFLAGEIILLAYDGTRYQIVNTSQAMFYLRPTSAYTIYVNTSTGSDTSYDGTSATVIGGTSSAGPFKTIGRAMTAAFSYAPSQYSITIQVAAGTYSEAVATPIQAGPNVIINGAGANATFISSSAANCFTCQGPNVLTVQNVQGSCSVNNNVFVAQQGGVMYTNNTESGGCGNVFCGTGGGTIFPGNHNFNGSSTTNFFAFYGGYVIINTFTFVYLGPIAVSDAVAMAFGTGVITVNNVNPPTFTNPTFVSGSKFLTQYNGGIATNGLGTSFFPGTVAGQNESGGYYV